MDVRRLSFQVEDLRGKIKVYCRVRPSNNSDKLKGNIVYIFNRL